MTIQWRDLLDAEINDRPLIGCALTHKSVKTQHNERLEFLGDAVLGLIVAEWLYLQRKDLNEGGLSQIRASLVNKTALARAGTQWGIDKDIRLSRSAEAEGGEKSERIIACAVEALFGAVYLLTGTKGASNFIFNILGFLLDEIPSDPEEIKDSKTKLQEIMQKRGLTLPLYRLISGPNTNGDNNHIVHCSACAASAIGQGRSRKEAEQAAANKCLGMLDKQKNKRLA